MKKKKKNNRAKLLSIPNYFRINIFILYYTSPHNKRKQKNFLIYFFSMVFVMRKKSFIYTVQSKCL